MNELAAHCGQEKEVIIMNNYKLIKMILTHLLTLLCLASIAYSQEEDVSKLIQELKSKDSDVRDVTARALWEIGTPAVEPLIASLKDKDPDVRNWAALSLWRIDTSQANKTVSGYVANKNLVYLANDYGSFIGKGEAGTEIFLIIALKEYGTLKMAEDFLNCGNIVLL